MKIKLNITVDINPKMWVRYCMNESAATPDEIRADVRSHFLNMVQCSELLAEADGTAEIVQ